MSVCTHTGVEYRVAGWQLRLRWWLLARLWSWGKGFEEFGAASPELANPLWRR